VKAAFIGFTSGNRFPTDLELGHWIGLLGGEVIGPNISTASGIPKASIGTKLQENGFRKVTHGQDFVPIPLGKLDCFDGFFANFGGLVGHLSLSERGKSEQANQQGGEWVEMGKSQSGDGP
jgi:hypothetical protein